MVLAIKHMQTCMHSHVEAIVDDHRVQVLSNFSVVRFSFYILASLFMNNTTIMFND